MIVAAVPRGSSRREAAVPDKHASSSSSTKMNVRPLALVLVLLHLHDSAGTPNLLLVLPGRSGHDTMRHATAPSDHGRHRERASQRASVCVQQRETIEDSRPLRIGSLAVLLKPNKSGSRRAVM